MGDRLSGRQHDETPSGPLPLAKKPADAGKPSIAAGIGPGWRPPDYRSLSSASATSNDVELRVEGVGTVKTFGQQLPTTAKGTFVLLFVSLRNAGSTDTFVGFGKLTDSAGQTYEEDAGASGAAGALINGGPVSLGPHAGETVKRVMAFDVPVGTTPSQLVMQTDLRSDPVAVPLG